MKRDDTIPQGATKLATLTLIRMAGGQLRVSVVEPTAELMAEFTPTPETADLMAYMRRLMKRAADDIDVPDLGRLGMPPPPCKGGQRRELDQWVCACGCGRRWDIGEERPV